VFTGIIEEVGVIRRRRDCNLTVVASNVLEGTRLGDSIAIDGACMTVVDFTAHDFRVQVSPESFKRTTLGDLRVGDSVNLERAMALGDRFGGHIVQGHVDGVGHVERIQRQGDFDRWTFIAPEEVLPYLVPKGSVTVNGISLTIIEPGNVSFDVAIIPTTLDETTLCSKGPGDRVNMEADIFGKHVRHYLRQVGGSGITKEMLTRHGFAEQGIG